MRRKIDYSRFRHLVNGAKIHNDDTVNRAVLRAQAGHRDGLEIVRQHVCRYVLSQAIKYGAQHSPERVEDLFQIGMMGAVKATERFNPDKARFLTLAAFWIRAYMTKLTMEDSTIRTLTTQDQRSIFMNMRKMTDEFHKLKPDSEKLDFEWASEKYGYSVDDLQAVYQHMRSPMVSLDAKVYGDESDVTVGDMLRSDMPSQEMQLEVAQLQKEARDRINNMLALLEPRQRDIVQSRLMNESENKPTLADLGKKYGVSREYVRQLEVAAISRLRELSRLSDGVLMKMVASLSKSKSVDGRRICTKCEVNRLHGNNRDGICGLCKRLARTTKPEPAPTTDPDMSKLTDEYLLKCVEELARRFKERSNAKHDAA